VLQHGGYQTSCVLRRALASPSAPTAAAPRAGPHRQHACLLPTLDLRPPGIAFLAPVLSLRVSGREEHHQQGALTGRAHVLRPLFPGCPSRLADGWQGGHAHAPPGGCL